MGSSEYLGQSQPAKANAGNRIAAFLIDAAVVFLLAFVPFVGFVLGLAYCLIRDGMEFGFMDRRSIGKQAMKLRPISLEGAPMDGILSIKRNWPCALGGLSVLFLSNWVVWIAGVTMIGIAILVALVETALIFVDKQGRRIGDYTARTQVIESNT